MDDLEQKKTEEGDLGEKTSRPDDGGATDLGGAVSYHSPAGLIDGTVEISVSPDAMAATATFYPPRGDGLPIEPAFVYELLRRMGVVSGLMEGNIAESAMSCNLDRRVLHDVVVAKGSEPARGRQRAASRFPRARDALHREGRGDDRHRHAEAAGRAGEGYTRQGDSLLERVAGNLRGRPERRAAGRQARRD